MFPKKWGGASIIGDKIFRADRWFLLLNELHLTANSLYHFVGRQKRKYFGHVTRHDGLQKTIMQAMGTGKRNRGNPRQKWDKDITDIFGTMTTVSRVAEDR